MLIPNEKKTNWFSQKTSCNNNKNRSFEHKIKIRNKWMYANLIQILPISILNLPYISARFCLLFSAFTNKMKEYYPQMQCNENEQEKIYLLKTLKEFSLLFVFSLENEWVRVRTQMICTHIRHIKIKKIASEYICAFCVEISLSYFTDLSFQSYC